MYAKYQYIEGAHFADVDLKEREKPTESVGRDGLFWWQTLKLSFINGILYGITESYSSEIDNYVQPHSITK